MLPTVPAGKVFADLAARVSAGGEVAPQHTGGIGGLAVTLASALLLLVLGSVAARLARRLARGSTPELIVLLDQSAAFYGRWPEDRLANAPRRELTAEAARCRRSVELLESLDTTASDPANLGSIAGLKAWIALLHKQLDGCLTTSSSFSHA